MSAELSQAIGWILFGVGLCLFISGAGEAPLFDPPEEEVPGAREEFFYDLTATSDAPDYPRIPTKETR